MSNFSRKELEAAPERKWDEVSEYDWLFLLPTRHKHDSGWHLIAIVGWKDGVLERAAVCDDIGWHNTHADQHRFCGVRSDMTYPAGVLRMWGNGVRFRVGPSLSSTEVEILRSEAA